MEREASIEDVIRAYTQTVYGVALTHTASRADADDVFQEVFAAYWRTKPTLNSEEHRKAWLIRTTLNFCLKSTQSSWAKKTVYVEGAPQIEAQARLASPLTEEYPDSDLSQYDTHTFADDGTKSPLPALETTITEFPSASFPFHTEQQTALYAAMQELRAPYRTVVQLFYFEDLPIAHIAQILDEEQGAIKTRLSRARAQLREKLKEGA